MDAQSDALLTFGRDHRKKLFIKQKQNTMLADLTAFLLKNPLIELGGVTLILVIIGYVVTLFRQPVLIGYIL